MSADTQLKPPLAAKPSRPARVPERKIGPFAGGVGVAIWLNHAETDQGPRIFRSITVNPRRYWDADSNQWKDAPSYNPTDLPALIFALQRAQAYVFETPLPDQPGSGGASNGEKPPQPQDEIPF
ncbi:MAG: hypothetical protein ACKVP0_14345 [Pirellulaceae bacterium]